MARRSRWFRSSYFPDPDPRPTVRVYPVPCEPAGMRGVASGNGGFAGGTRVFAPVDPPRPLAFVNERRSAIVLRTSGLGPSPFGGPLRQVSTYRGEDHETRSLPENGAGKEAPYGQKVPPLG